MVQTPAAHGSRARRAYEQLGRIGSRRTVARQLVLDALDEAGGHRSAAEIHARISEHAPSLTLSTVYRTLTTLTEHGLVHTYPLNGESLFGFADIPHHHSICIHCGGTTEIPAEAIADLVDQLQHVGKLTLAADGVTLRGTCEKCGTVSSRTPARARRR